MRLRIALVAFGFCALDTFAFNPVLLSNYASPPVNTNEPVTGKREEIVPLEDTTLAGGEIPPLVEEKEREIKTNFFAGVNEPTKIVPHSPFSMVPHSPSPMVPYTPVSSTESHFTDTLQVPDSFDEVRVPESWEADEDLVEIVQGGSLKTWSFQSPHNERIQMRMTTDGRPLNADIELWEGPENTPQKMSVFIEGGDTRTFNAVFEYPQKQSSDWQEASTSTLAVKNLANMEYSMLAIVEAAMKHQRPLELANSVAHFAQKTGDVVEGGAMGTYPVEPSVSQVSVVVKNDGSPLTTRIELVQGPGKNKQTVEAYCDDGLSRPVQLVIDTPGSGNVVRVVHTGSAEYPITVSVEPFVPVESFPVEELDDEFDDEFDEGFDSGFDSGFDNGFDPIPFIGEGGGSDQDDEWDEDFFFVLPPSP